jgi:hypothetical protein
VRKELLFELRNVLELNQSLLKGLQNAQAHISCFMRVSGLVIFKLEVDSEEGELLFVSTHLLDFILREVHVCDSVSVKDMD